MSERLEIVMDISQGAGSPIKVSAPTPEEIDEAFGRLIPALNHFLIIGADPAIDGFSYVQTRLSQADSLSLEYIVEARRNLEEGFQQFATLITSESQVMRLFRLFALGVPPDVQGWEDITQQVMKETEDKKASRTFKPTAVKVRKRKR